jgi:hypothetical protein
LTATSPDRPPIPQHPIGPNPPKSVKWRPVEIVYSQLTMTDPSDPSTALMNLQNYIIPIEPGQQDPVASFVQMRQSDPSAPVQHNGAYPNNDPDKGPCDIYVENQCHIVIEIDHTIPWTFCTTQPSITLKAVYTHDGDDDNFGLSCVRLDPTAKFASFSVAIRSPSSGPTTYTKEGFNIVVQTQEATPTIYVIDPDTTNQGGIPANLCT